MNLLIQYWPNLYGDDVAFWKWEYEKHGSCFDPFYLDQSTYFVSAFVVSHTINLSNVLSVAGSLYFILHQDNLILPIIL